VAAAVQATTPDASAEPRLYFELLRGPVVAGEPSQVRLRFDPPAAARPETLEARLQHDGAEQPLPLRPGAAPGELTADVALPDPGLWIIPLRFRDAQDRRWLGWASIRAVTDPDAYAPVLPTLRVRLQPDRTIPDLPLTPLSVLGTALVLLTIAAAVVGSAVALRAVERDAGSVSAA
jgi:hypothetical protein